MGESRLGYTVRKTQWKGGNKGEDRYTACEQDPKFSVGKKTRSAVHIGSKKKELILNYNQKL